MKSNRAFTLIEMLVVIGIIGILAAVLMGTFSGGTESAHAATCLSNMRNLAAACQSFGAGHGYYPPAGSFETVTVVESNGKAKKRYSEVNGWIAWNSQYAYKPDANGDRPTSHKSSASWNTSMYAQSESAREYVMTNGVLWRYVNGSHSAYICPQHARKKKSLKPNWSYCMNANFKWDTSKGKKAFDAEHPGVTEYGSLSKADKRLLFAEIPFVEHDGVASTPEDTSGEKCDSILQYKGCRGCGSAESIGFNHRNGKQYYANVVFADGHTEKLVYPKNGMSESDLQNLTMWLCTALDVSFNGKKYDKMEN